jgi:hypothetical protein
LLEPNLREILLIRRECAALAERAVPRGPLTNNELSKLSYHRGNQN